MKKKRLSGHNCTCYIIWNRRDKWRTGKRGRKEKREDMGGVRAREEIQMSEYGLGGMEKMDEGLRVKLATPGSSKSMDVQKPNR